jgi:predicted ester cyclase
MKSINDLRIIDFDYLIAKDDQVALRYSAEGSHSGEPYKGIQATGRKAKWTAAALFKLNQEGKITL